LSGVLLLAPTRMPETHHRAVLLFVLATVAVGQACSGRITTGVDRGGSGGVGGDVKAGSGGSGGEGGSATSGDGGGGSGGGGGGGSGEGGAPACPGNAFWLKRYGDTLQQVGISVAADAAGNVVVAGVFEGSIDFGSGPLTTVGPGGYGVYVAKLDASGNPLWSHAYPGGYDFVFGGALPFATVAVAPSGDVVLGGVFAGTVDFGAGPLTATSTEGDGFVVAFDPIGAPLWSAHFSDPPPNPTSPVPIRPQTVESLAVDPAGNTLVLGYRYVGTWGAMFLVKLDPAGNPVWRKDVSASGSLESTIRADAAGNVLVAGIAYEPIDFGGGAIPTSPAISTLFRAKLDPTGAQLWSQGVLTTGFTLHPGNGLAVDPAGNVFIAGGGGNIGFDAGCGMAPPAWGIKIMQFDAATGACGWMWGLPGPGAALAVDPAGRAVLASDDGTTLITCPDSGIGLPASACEQTFMQGSGTPEVRGLAASPGARVLMTGDFTGTIGFASDPTASVTSAGQKDVFVASF
jgi:hypothetical protein